MIKLYINTQLFLEIFEAILYSVKSESTINKA